MVCNGQEFNVESFDGKMINGMLFRCQKPNSEDEESFNPEASMVPVKILT